MDTIVLSHANCGKYCSKRYDALRAEARNDLTALGDKEKDFAETSNMPLVSINKPGYWEIETVPMPWYDKLGPDLIDVRKTKSPIDREGQH